MKIRALEIYWHPGTSTLRDTVLQHMRGDPEVRKIAARMARAEVKNYLAEIAEIAELPFSGPTQFLRSVKQETNVPFGSCEFCGVPFAKTGSGGKLRKYCSGRCRVATYRARKTQLITPVEKDSDESPDSL